MRYKRIVLNEPHASVEGLYDDRLSGWAIDDRFINEVVFRLTDWHSFPEDMGDVDVCIGFNEDWSKPDKELLEYAVNLFEENCYSVGINYPYSNSEAPACLFGYQSMMLEVNKRVYLERRSLYLKTRSDKKKSVREVVNQLLETLT